MPRRCADSMAKQMIKIIAEVVLVDGSIVADVSAYRVRFTLIGVPCSRARLMESQLVCFLFTGCIGLFAQQPAHSSHTTVK